MAAMENPHILACSVDAAEFPALAAGRGVRAVPHTVIDGRSQRILVGAQPVGRWVAELLRACGHD